MTRLSHRDPMPTALRGAIIALGNFDGFHLGHQHVVRAAVEWAREEGRPAIVATFDPHPVRHFAPHVPPFRLTSLAQREELFEEAGAAAMLVFDFGNELAATPAESFVRDLLAERLCASGVVTGEDFTFGKDRGGNVGLLREVGASCGITARAIGPVGDAVDLKGQTISSSRIRDALKAGECEAAARLLTRPFTVRGTVIHGDKRGRELGYPTANIDMGSYIRPRFGIYAVTGRVLATGQELQGAANLGVRPSFDPPKELLEPYFFDFEGDLYGQELDVAFHHFLRPEARFDSLDELKAQMAKDCDEARRLLAER
ncbi:bifunctional riboflavin kinase/FAD synthetase [Aurantiacibacter poecillastricola]|uniref:bifunctional riboflavin kinase/FAD synthetase n=1 Tax=Aurantiacibacter poecillastricola TaxID=3064385 RepID=UPI00273EC5B1|nr:bifunctional riboflavin kinase/FAD synthetase [Aurantiacibacter sp. 219JJ12-13]MDP5260429.1 bifunctional riboflavin kinase/FAD synthetase [Aurantiacibacter sp. 219JJ12-13]